MSVPKILPDSLVSIFQLQMSLLWRASVKINSNKHPSDQLFTGVFHISVDTSARAVFYSWSPNDLKEDQEGPKVMGPRTLIT